MNRFYLLHPSLSKSFACLCITIQQLGGIALPKPPDRITNKPPAAHPRNKGTLFEIKHRRLKPLPLSLLSISLFRSLLAPPLVQQLTTSKRALNRGIARVQGGSKILLVLCLGVRVDQLPGGDGCLDVRDAVLVHREEVVIPLIKVLGLREEFLQFRVDGFGDFGGDGFFGVVQGLAEAEGLGVDSWVRGVEGVCGREALLRKGELVCG